MRNKLLVVLTVCCGCVAMTLAGDAPPPKTHPDSAGWDNLLAEDLSNAI